MDRVREELEQKKTEAEKVGSRIYTSRSPQEVSEEIKILTAHLAALADVSEEAEKTYQKLLRTYEDLKEKLAVLTENKHRLLEEVELRKTVWLRKIKELLLNLNNSYSKILASVGGRGEVRLVNSQSFEKAGLELTVGFHGVPPRRLDAYTQSGGERSVTIMAFLLALQRYIASPIRAVDEFDVHCDPRNRELLWRLTVSTVREAEDTQYIVITPGQLPLASEEIDNVIVVQKVGGKSEVRTVVEEQG
jgi:chromosome segregation protein